MWAPTCRNSGCKNRLISCKSWRMELRKAYSNPGFLISFATLRSGVCCPLKSLSIWLDFRLESGRFRVMVSTLVRSILASSWSDLTLPLVKSWYHFQLRAMHNISSWLGCSWRASLKIILFLFPTLRGSIGYEQRTGSSNFKRCIMSSEGLRVMQLYQSAPEWQEETA